MLKTVRNLVAFLIIVVMTSLSVSAFAASTPKYVSVMGGSQEVYFTTTDGKLFVTKSESNDLVQIKGITNVKMASDDVYFGLWVLDKSGNVYYYLQDYKVANKFTEKKKIDGLQKIKAISVGAEGICALKEDGTVWDVDYDKKVSKVEGLSNITSISMRDNFAVALKKDGTVWHWSNGSALSRYYEKLPATQIKGLTNVKEISAGAECGMVLKKDGTVWQWGFYSDNKTPVKVTGFTGTKSIVAGRMDGYSIDSKGNVWKWKLSGEVAPKPAKVAGLSGIVQVAASGKDSVDGFSFGRLVALDKNYKIK